MKSPETVNVVKGSILFPAVIEKQKKREKENKILDFNELPDQSLLICIENKVYKKKKKRKNKNRMNTVQFNKIETILLIITMVINNTTWQDYINKRLKQ